MSILAKVLLSEPENEAKIDGLPPGLQNSECYKVLFEFLFLELLVPGHHFQLDVLIMLGWKVILFLSGACMLDCWLSGVPCSVPLDAI